MKKETAQHISQLINDIQLCENVIERCKDFFEKKDQHKQHYHINAVNINGNGLIPDLYLPGKFYSDELITNIILTAEGKAKTELEKLKRELELL